MTNNVDYLSNANAVKQKAVQTMRSQFMEEVEARFEIKLSEIDPNPFQPRVEFSHVEEMARSLREEGQHYAILVRMIPSGRYQVADGETRVRAAKYNLEHFPEHPNTRETIGAVLKRYTNEEMALLAFSTAYNRKSLNPIEEARGILRMRDELKLPFTELAKKLGRPESYFYERSRLLHLPVKLQECIGQSKLTASQAINIGGFNGPEEQLDAIINEVVEQELTVSAIRKRVKELQAETPAAEPKSKTPLSSERKAWSELRDYWKQLDPEAREQLLTQARALVPARDSTNETGSVSAQVQEEVRPATSSLRAAPKPSASKPQAPLPETPVDLLES